MLNTSYCLLDFMPKAKSLASYNLDGLRVSVDCLSGCLVEDFIVNDLWIVLFESGAWAVEFMDTGKYLGFDSSGAC
jgi:hypothetical protein